MTPTIADRTKSLLPAALHPVVDARTAEGVRKYGQTLDDNVKPERAKAVHLLQEVLDASAYIWWRYDAAPEGRQTLFDVQLMRLAGIAADVLGEFPDLTTEEMLHREGHSGTGETIALPRWMVERIAATLEAVEDVLDTSVERRLSIGGRAAQDGQNPTHQNLASVWHALNRAYSVTHPSKAMRTLLTASPEGLEVVRATTAYHGQTLTWTGPRALLPRDYEVSP